MRVTKHFKTSVTNTPEHMHRGVFSSNKRGFGFVSVEGIDEDFFIPLKYTMNAFNGDIVNIKELPQRRGKRKEAKIVKIVSHGIIEVVGTYEKISSYGFVRPDNPKISTDIYIPLAGGKEVYDGAKVVCVISDYGSKNKNPSGYIKEIIGDTKDPYIDIYSIAKAFDIDSVFPEDCIDEALSIPTKISARDKKGRINLTEELIISIDGDDSKDLDDAISLVKKDGIYTLGVHIADVSHYVREKTALDREAYKRGTSVYLIDVVIPMLHEQLSNGICSLLQDEERLTLSCIMKIDSKGNVIDSSINQTFIKNKRRMTYNKVNEILSSPKGEAAKAETDVVPMLLEMKRLADILNKARKKRGAIDFDMPEAKIALDKNGKPVSISARTRGVSEGIIEEFMLIANETVAKTCFDSGLPLLYRSHPKPEQDRVRELIELCNLFGIPFRAKNLDVKPINIQRLLSKSKGLEQESLMSSVTLRCMQQARYSYEDTYHFGLAAPFYCHFTSPIRRYPDLLVHRIIKENMKKPLGSRKRKHFEAITSQAGEHTSRLERRAIECEREVDKLKKCEYIKANPEEEYDSIISGVTGWGLYVMLPNTIEGMVPIGSIKGDYYIYKEKQYAIVGERSRKSYRLGDKVRVRLEKVDTISRTIDFALL